MTSKSPAEISSAMPRLAALVPGRILFDPWTRESFRTDFGRWRHRTPAAVARCQTAEEVARVIRFCRDEGIAVATRSQGHTQSGQSLTEGVLIDSSGMNQILAIDEREGWADCQAGVIWRDLVMVSLQQGMIPPVLTNNLSVSIAGTTSVAGLGVASFRYGTQADNALEIECVTGDGEIHVCSREQEPELFDMVRCGMGQVAFITRVKTRLRHCQPMIRQYTLVYDELDAWMADAAKVLDPANPTFSTAGGICTPAPLGFRKMGEGIELGKGMIGTALWLYPMYLTVEFTPGREPDDARVLAGLSPWRHPQTMDLPVVEFARRMEPMFEAWRLSGYWENPHPWMETTLPWETAKDYIETILSNLPPGALGSGGHVLLWPARTDTSQVPLFAHPPGDRVLGWGILGGVHPSKLDEMLAQLDMASELSIGYGGKRYLSGFITFDTPERWRAHFGDAAWERLRVAKKRWDPAGILGSGFIQFD